MRSVSALSADDTKELSVLLPAPGEEEGDGEDRWGF